MRAQSIEEEPGICMGVIGNAYEVAAEVWCCGSFNSTIHANLLEQKWREFVEVLAPVDAGMAKASNVHERFEK